MNVFVKLRTLLRAGVRESAELVTDANAIRIYRQELVDAQSVMTQRRESLAALIATRCELEDEIERLQLRVVNKEQQVRSMPEAERDDDLLQLAARDIATTEAHLADTKHRHVEISEMIQREEILLRRLLSEINQHQRDLKLLSAQMQRQQYSPDRGQGTSISARLAELRETRQVIQSAVGTTDYVESGMDEAIERTEGSSLDRKLKERGYDQETRNMEIVLRRLRSIGASA